MGFDGMEYTPEPWDGATLIEDRECEDCGVEFEADEKSDDTLCWDCHREAKTESMAAADFERRAY